MEGLASKIRDQLDELSHAYSQRLREIKSYATLPEAERRDLARQDLERVAACLASGQVDAFLEDFQAQVEAWRERGKEADVVPQTVAVLEETLMSLDSTAQATAFLWRVFSQLRTRFIRRVYERTQESEQKFRALADNLPVGLFIHQGGVLRYIGRHGARALGYEHPEELLGHSIMDFVHPEERARIADIARRRVEGEPVPDRYDSRLLKRDGTAVEVWFYNTLIDYEGQVATQGIFLDVTERVRAERALEVQRAFLRQVIDISPNFIFVKDREGRFVLANQAMAEAYGTTVENMIGKTDADFNIEEAERFHRDDLQVMDALQEKFIPEELMTDESGRVRWLQTIKRPLLNEAGVADRVLGVVADISERKRLEMAWEEMYKRRAQQVQLITEVAQEIATAPALEELFKRVVTLIKERFDYYHAQIFHYEPALNALLLVSSAGGTGGQAGEHMLQAGHRLEMGRALRLAQDLGVVGTAAATGQPVLVDDMTQDPDWIPSPYLPDAKGELAVPIKMRDRVLGILDVQSDVAGALTEEDQLLLEGLCGQIAIAIESTRLRQEMEENLQELRFMQGTASRDGWLSLRKTADLKQGYLFDRMNVRPVDDLWQPELDFIDQAMAQKALIIGRDSQPTEEAPADDSHLPSSALTAREGKQGPHLPSLAVPGELVEGRGSVVVAPMLVHGQSIGALGVYDDPEQPLSPDEQALVQAVSEQVALALEGARLSEQTRATLADTEALYQASAKLNAAQTFEDILETLREDTLLRQADINVSLHLFDRPWEGQGPHLPSRAVPGELVEGQGPHLAVPGELVEGQDVPEWQTVVARWSTLPTQTLDRRYPLRAFGSSELLRPDEPTIISDAQTDSRLDKAFKALLTGRSYPIKARGVLFVPLVVGGRWIGYINAMYSAPLQFESADTEMRRLMTLSGQAAVTIQSIRQLQRIQARAQREQQLREITNRLRTPPDVDGVMRVLAQELGQALGRRAVVRLTDDKSPQSQDSGSSQDSGGRS